VEGDSGHRTTPDTTTVPRGACAHTEDRPFAGGNQHESHDAMTPRSVRFRQHTGSNGVPSNEEVLPPHSRLRTWTSRNDYPIHTGVGLAGPTVDDRLQSLRREVVFEYYDLVDPCGIDVSHLGWIVG
jgi:hypothetical protein